MQNKSHYDVLGINQNASKDDIKRAFRTLAKKHHPDKAGASSVKIFNNVLKAYQVLSDDVERSYYDQTLAIVTTPFRDSNVRNANPSRAVYNKEAIQHGLNWVYLASIVAIYASMLFIVSIIT